MSTSDFTPAELAELLYGWMGEQLRPLVVLYVERYGEAVAVTDRSAVDLVVSTYTA